jgi:hypothetical protein
LDNREWRLVVAPAQLEPGNAEVDFKRHYNAMLNGATLDPFTQTALAGLLVTRELRKECLNEKAAELNNELSELKARSKTLAKTLGQNLTSDILWTSTSHLSTTV